MREEWEVKPKGPNWFLIMLLVLLFIGTGLIFKVNIVNFIDDNFNIEPHVEEVPESYCTKEQINDMFREMVKVLNDPDAINIEFYYGEGFDGSSKLKIITTDESENVSYYSYRSDCMD